MSPAFRRVAALDQVRDGFVTLFKVAGRPVIVARIGDNLTAYPGTCTHADFRLSTSRLLKGCEIECPVHGAVFDARSGAVTKGPATVALTAIAVKIEGDDVLVGVDWPETE